MLPLFPTILALTYGHTSLITMSHPIGHQHLLSRLARLLSFP
jgi:hypothetical protein